MNNRRLNKVLKLSPAYPRDKVNGTILLIGTTQAALAQDLGISRATLSRVIRARTLEPETSAQGKHQRRLARALHVKPGAIWT
jgi:plasmid maintenance system antidote protein VapI